MCRNERRRTPKGDADDEFTVPCKVRRGDRSAGGRRGLRDSDANGCVRSVRADVDGHSRVERIDDRWQVTQAQRRQVGLEEDRAGRRLRVCRWQRLRLLGAPGEPDQGVFYLDGGGVCVDATSCAFTSTGGEGENDFYNWNLSGENPAFPGDGILDLDRAENPFAHYSFIYVASCTGDLDLGDVTREYSPQLTVEHNGFVNGTAALDYLAEHYPHATQVVVVGKTGGSVAAPVYGGLVADLLPDAQVTVFGAQSGAFPDIPDFNATFLGELWGAYDNMPDWEVNEGLTARDWGIPRFWIQAGLHDPDIVMARFDYAFDPNAAGTVEWMGGDASNLLALIDANEAAIEAAGVVQHSYTAPGEEHQILDIDKFYEMEVNGVRLVDWVDALRKGKPLDDVHCEQCETP
jgi:Pectinacetylesterase